MITIKVPATSANLGPGFDTLGLALDSYLELTIEQESPNWFIKHAFGPHIPTDEQNLIVSSALSIDANLPAHTLQVHSPIPLARGLGSSSSAIVAGIVLAHVLRNETVSRQQVFQEAAAIEGHPDNVAPAVFGGLQLSSVTEEGRFSSTTLPFPEELIGLALIPNYAVSTKKARAILPKKLRYKQVVQQGNALARLIAACYTTDAGALRQLVEEDQIHEQYRARLCPALPKVRELEASMGIHGSYLSGAGPTIMTLATADEIKRLQAPLTELQKDAIVQKMPISQQGYQIIQQ